MTKIVQLNGGSAAQQKTYIGPIRELTVDTTNFGLRLHDGVTPGGYIFNNQDTNDVRYQAKSLELDGLSGFPAEQRGFLARLGPSDYELRDLTVDTDGLTLSNADGYSGNPLIGLASTIQSDHEFAGAITFSGPSVVFDVATTFNAVPSFAAGAAIPEGFFLAGDVIGDLTGDVLGDTTGTHTGPVIGPVDVRGETLLLDDNQIGTSKINGLQAFVAAHGVPGGIIMLWSGNSASIPTGWFLCNGLNGTPDLRSRFVRGAGADSDVGFDAAGATGGLDEVTPSATSGLNGAHTHTISGTTSTEQTGASLNKVFKQVDAADQTGCMEDVGFTDPGHDHTIDGTAASAGNHDHTITCAAQENRPAYYALCYIMKA